jgi:dihydrofolate synthase/folylpolyglutamate synthase
MIAAILSAAGYRTGLYTSPHLEQIEERLTVDGQPCKEFEFANLVNRLLPAVAELDELAGRNGGYEQGPTYFEITTAAAMLHFADRQVEAAVLEVGLGGRLDSTNVCQAEIAVITSISFDHTRQLGNTLAKIAGEKAGIIKFGIPVVSGVTDTEPAEVIRRRAAEQECPYFELGRDFQVRYRRSEYATRANSGQQVAAEIAGVFDYAELTDGSEQDDSPFRVGLPGLHQASNAAVAIATCRRLRDRGWNISEQAIRVGLEQVRVPARTELIQHDPPVIIDAAHNVASVNALLSLLDELFPKQESRILIFATSQDKDLQGMLRRLVPKFDRVILTRFLNNPRYVEPAELKRMADEMKATKPEDSGRILVEACPAAAWTAAEALAGDGQLICVTGSFFLAAEIRRLARVSPLRPSARATVDP